jgi:plasmid replication initiation protein
MEQNEEKKDAIIQPNAITTARYEYTKLQKDFMIHYIDAMNKYMTKDGQIQPDLFGNIVLDFELRNMCKADHHGEMLKAIKDLQKKPISYEYNRKDGRYEVTTTLIATLIHKKGTGKIRIQTTEASIPFVMWLGHGFTQFDKNTALSLPSVYAKRIYELCCQWKDKGFCRITVEQFRQMLSIEKKYKQLSELKANVLDISEKQIKEMSGDIWFTYSLRKENGSKSYNWIEFNIQSNLDNNKEGKWYQDMYNFLYPLYRDFRAYEACEYISGKKESKKAAERFSRMAKDIDKGKVKSYGMIAYLNKVLEDEFNVPADITQRGMETAKKKAQKKIDAAFVIHEKKAKIKEAEERQRQIEFDERKKEDDIIRKTILEAERKAKEAGEI